MSEFLDYQFAHLGLSEWLAKPGVTEICINRPGELFVEYEGRWIRQTVAAASFEALRSFCIAVVNGSRTGQRITETEPMVSLTFPGGQRAQLVIPPACAPETISITLRIPAQSQRTLVDYLEQGYFADAHRRADEPGGDAELRALLKARQWPQFFELCVRSRRNIVVAGATGSGKTSFMKSLVNCIPAHERLITIEDARELELKQANAVHLLYSKGNQGLAKVTPRDCMEACLRMRPDRILLAELRGDEAFYYLRSCASGHPGSITSCHAGSASQTWSQLALMVKASPEGAALDMPTIHALLRSSIDVMVHVAIVDGRRRMTGVHLTADIRQKAGAQRESLH